MKKSLTIIILTLAAVSAFGFSLYEKDFGNKTTAVNARTAAMGGAAICGGNRLFDANLNPANLALQKKQFNLEGGFLITRTEENRKVPMYNFFDSYIDDAVYSSNTNFFNLPSIGASASYKLNANKFALGLMYKPELDFSFDYEEEVRNNENSDNDNFPKVIANNYFEGEGNLNSISLMAAYSFENQINVAPDFVISNLALGIEYSMLNGSKKQAKQIIWTDYAKNIINDIAYDALPDYHAEKKYDIEGSRINIGLNAEINERFALGFAYKTKASLDYDEKTFIDDENNPLTVNNFDLPASYNIGLKYMPRSFMRSTVNWDFVVEQYSDVDDKLEDSYTFKFGVEHYIKHRLPLRLGFSYQTSALDKELTIPTFSCGTGYEIMPNLNFDIAFSFSNRSFNQADLFADGYYDDTQYTGQNNSSLWISNFKPRSRTDEDKVEELFMKINSSISYKW